MHLFLEINFQNDLIEYCAHDAFDHFGNISKTFLK